MSILTLLLVFGVFAAQAKIGMNLADEGYLWYGVWRVNAGEMPRVDFRAYDPPRNYWIAVWTQLLGTGPVGIRAAIAIFQAIGFAFGLLAMSRAVHDRRVLALAAVLLLAWMWPNHRLFEPAIALTAVFVAVWLLEHPSLHRAFLSGFFVGLAAAFRRNHGVYTILPLAILVGYYAYRRASWRCSATALAIFASGIVVGFFPIWVLVLIEPELASAYLDSVLMLFHRGMTNQPLPIPWPWTVELSGNALVVAHRLAVGIGFVLLFAFFPVAAWILARTTSDGGSSRKLLIATFTVGLTYSHHAAIRSDLSHLAQSFHPALLGMLVLLTAACRGWRRALQRVGIGLIVLVTALGPLVVQPGVHKLLYPQLYVRHSILGDRLWVNPEDARLIEEARAILRESEHGETIFFAPNLPGMYRILEQPSPVWDTYPLWPTDSGQRRMIESLSRGRVRWAIIYNRPFAGARFAENHPVVWEYLQTNYRVSTRPALPRPYTLLERNDGQ